MKPRAPSFIEFPFRKFDTEAQILGRMGSLETRLARSKAEIRAAQALRYAVFYEEMGAKPSKRTKLLRRDKDHLDRYCDHLLVIDTSLDQHNQIVGTYRMMDHGAARAAGGFYSQSEFDLTPLLSANSDRKYLELGRSCIAKPYRSRRTIELMWQGIWATVLERNIDTIFGCASFAGTNPTEHRQALSWLHANALVDAELDCPAAKSDSFRLPKPRPGSNTSRRDFSALPPLLKGYLRVGAKVAGTAVVDRQFRTIDVLVLLDVAQISDKYIAHYGEDASRFAA